MVEIKESSYIQSLKERGLKEKFQKELKELIKNIISKEKGDLRYSEKERYSQKYFHIKEKSFKGNFFDYINISYGWGNININVYDSEYFDLAKKIGENIEKRFEKKVTIYKEYFESKGKKDGKNS